MEIVNDEQNNVWCVFCTEEIGSIINWNKLTIDDLCHVVH